MWSASLNMLMQRIRETDLLYPTKEFIYTMEHERNPFKDDEVKSGKKKLRLNSDVRIGLLYFIAVLILWTYLFLLEIIIVKSRIAKFKAKHRSGQSTWFVLCIFLLVAIHKIRKIPIKPMEFGIKCLS